MKFSLIVATKHRVEEVARLFQSLAIQSHRDFELILVDGNRDDRVVPVVNRYEQQFPIVHLKELRPGVSRARNCGLAHAKGDLVAIPDDDCIYTPDLLANMADFFQNEPQWDSVIARVYDLDKDQNAYEWCGDDLSGPVDTLERACSLGMTQAQFHRAHVVQAITFDERLGPGAGTPHGAAEDLDYLFRCILAGYQVYYNAQFIVRHPNPQRIYNFRQLVRRTYNYGRGNGYLYGRYFPPEFTKSKIYANVPWVWRAPLKGRYAQSAYLLAEIAGLSLGYWDSVRARQKQVQ